MTQQSRRSSSGRRPFWVDDEQEFIIWRCPRCLGRGWSTIHVPSRHRTEDTKLGEWCSSIPDAIRVKKVGDA